MQGNFWPGIGSDPFNSVEPAHVERLLQEHPDLAGVYLADVNVFALPATPQPQIVNLYDDGQFADLRGVMESAEDVALIAFLEAELAKHSADLEAGRATTRLKVLSR